MTYNKIGKDAKFYFSLTSLPGNEEVFVSHNSYVVPELRANGFGQAMHKEKLELMSNYGGRYALATVDDENQIQKHIMEKNGWKILDSFLSLCTCHKVLIYGRQLP